MLSWVRKKSFTLECHMSHGLRIWRGGGMRKGITIPQPLIFIHSLNRDFGFRNQQRLATGRVQIRIADVC